MKKTYLKDVAYQKLKEKILTGHYSDKNHTSENELVEEFEMSRTPIREALQRLPAESLEDLLQPGCLLSQPLCNFTALSSASLTTTCLSRP
ncbi:GntR family transcriptional regulator [Brevibacillus centrosporus]|uniref:GntR family transcriptional regulator n=1 Tax=Brevibacillus centrosporus TaxID=54910 RepID=UPI00399CD2B2